MKDIILPLSILAIVYSCGDRHLGTEGNSLVVADQNIKLELSSGAYRYSNLTYATSCLSYQSSPSYNDEGDGLYWIDPDGSGPEVEITAKCDMTTNGGGWTLIANRRGGFTSNEECGTNLNEFFSSPCGSIENISYSDSYSVGDSSVRANIISVGKWMFLQYDISGTLDSDDAFIINNNAVDLFFESIDVLNETSVSSVCDISDSNCDFNNVVFMWIGNRWFNSAKCNGGISGASTHPGNYGYCHNGTATSYNANSLFGDRSGYQETKLWSYSGGSQNYQERIWVK